MKRTGEAELLSIAKPDRNFPVGSPTEMTLLNRTNTVLDIFLTVNHAVSFTD